MKRRILHVDQNCYFASVEMIAHPEYRNVPMAVVGSVEKRHGIVLAKNYLASAAGVKTAEVIWKAEQKCPNLVKAEAHFEKYSFYSKRLREMYSEYSDRVEPFGLDECWIDISESCLDRDAKSVADEIRQRVKEEFSLSCSVGVSFNKVFAKLGSDYKKPDATTVFSEEEFRDVVWKLPVEELLFVGRSTKASLHKINIRTIGDLANASESYLSSYLGKGGVMLWRYANGLDDDEVMKNDYKRDIKSVGNSTTPSSDMRNIKDVSGVMHSLAASVASRLRKYELLGTVVQIWVRDKNLNSYEKQRVLFEPSNNEKEIYETALELFRESYNWHAAIRSVGVRCTKLISKNEGIQLSIFDDCEKLDREKKLDNTVDEINRRYGPGAIKRLVELNGDLGNFDPSRTEGGICGKPGSELK
jgi:DNA polymerase IV